MHLYLFLALLQSVNEMKRHGLRHGEGDEISRTVHTGVVK